MKRFVDYEPTAQEIAWIFGTKESYEAWITVRDEYSSLDSEKNRIAKLLKLRGHEEEALKIIESIEDEEYREDCLHDFNSGLVRMQDGSILLVD